MSRSRDDSKEDASENRQDERAGAQSHRNRKRLRQNLRHASISILGGIPQVSANQVSEVAVYCCQSGPSSLYLARSCFSIAGGIFRSASNGPPGEIRIRKNVIVTTQNSTAIKASRRRTRKAITRFHVGCRGACAKRLIFLKQSRGSANCRGSQGSCRREDPESCPLRRTP